MKDDYLYFYLHYISTKSYQNRSDPVKWKVNWTEWFDQEIRAGLYSSNNPQYLDAQVGYYFCREGTLLQLVQSKFINGNLNGICKNQTIFIPGSNSDLTEAQNSVKKFIIDRLRTTDQAKLTIFTDYKRKNETHFWSETTRNWLDSSNVSIMDDVYLNFKKWVVCDGYKKLTNSLDSQSCICIVEQRTNWQLKLLISLLIASFTILPIRFYRVRKEMNRNHSEQSEQNNITETVL